MNIKFISYLKGEFAAFSDKVKPVDVFGVEGFELVESVSQFDAKTMLDGDNAVLIDVSDLSPDELDQLGAICPKQMRIYY